VLAATAGSSASGSTAGVTTLLPMVRRRRPALWVFAIWTLFVWGQRVVNVFTVGDLDGAEQAGALVRPAVFTILGLALIVVAVRPTEPATVRTVVQVAAGITVLQWVVQCALIAFRDYSVPFIVVHLVLGVVSVSLAVWALRSVSGSVRVDDPPAAVAGP